MWAADGIVCPVEGETDRQVLIQAGKRSLSGNVTTCRLHDLMRDLCLSKAKEENFQEVIHLQDGNKAAIGDFSSSMVSLVRQSTVEVRRLAIYLDQGIRSGGEIPNVLWKMQQLRHLYLPWSYKIIDAEKLRLDTLTNLEILRYIDPDKCCVKDLVKLKNLRKLHIHAIKSIEQLDVIFKPPSPVLRRIRSLSLHFFNGRIEEGDLRQLLSGCHHDLYGLYLAAGITSYFCGALSFEEDPTVTLEKLPHLKFLSLSETFIGMEMVCSGKGFPQLKYLSLSLFPNVEKWRVDEGSMPSLGDLRIMKCQQLREVLDGLRLIVTLQKMEVSGMPETFLDRLREGGEDFHKVQHIPSIEFMELES
ncbi:hypothetical protein PVL29_002741 [Vitis rotundifolia]|uniref:Disease resistance R13L4/SHOC-2-like LRR domain-containing protein n=1 Tax=Vitis rotundifolia TaxID=103349 RepID=A0AA39E2L0_VITRO|nr:hypothetical protein PVL29_002741 [Vitis rotundifolia]